MNSEKAIEVLEALASGCSPITGEVLAEESVLNDRSVIRALQIAVDQLRDSPRRQAPAVEIDTKDVDEVIKLFLSVDKAPTVNRILVLLMGGRRFRDNLLINSPLYGKYAKSKISSGQFIDFLTDYLEKKGIDKQQTEPVRILFFEGEPYNNLSIQAQEKLKQRIISLGMKKTEDLSRTIIQSRVLNPRSYEPWGKEESNLLQTAMEYTNDLAFLKTAFQRGESAIQSYGEKMIGEKDRLLTVKSKIGV